MIRVASIQIAPIFLDSEKTWNKLSQYISEAASKNAELVTWGETLIPGYPVWISRSDGARFNNPQQKRVYAKYWKEAIHLGKSKIIDEMKELRARRSWVLSTSGLIRSSDFSHLSENEFPVKKLLTSVEGSLQNGGSIIVDPKGDIVAGPLINEEGILYYDVDPYLAIEERQNLDISGHYSRFDIFNEPLNK
jgi:predicted amidohydrolase